jgi:hypothetical protein
MMNKGMASGNPKKGKTVKKSKASMKKRPKKRKK